MKNFFEIFIDNYDLNKKTNPIKNQFRSIIKDLNDIKREFDKYYPGCNWVFENNQITLQCGNFPILSHVVYDAKVKR